VAVVQVDLTKELQALIQFLILKLQQEAAVVVVPRVLELVVNMVLLEDQEAVVAEVLILNLEVAEQHVKEMMVVIVLPLVQEMIEVLVVAVEKVQ